MVLDLPPTLPIALKLAGRTCLVVGGGRIGERKVRELLRVRANVIVVAPQFCQELIQLSEGSTDLSLVQRPFTVSDLDAMTLVITATGVPEVDGAVYEAATARGLWANSADDPEHCTFYLTAVVRRDPVAVAVSTSGASPALASYLRRRLDAILEEEIGPLAIVLHEARRELHARGESTESRAWDQIVNDELVALAVAGNWELVRSHVAQLTSELS